MTYYKCELPDWLIVSCWSAMEIYLGMRAIVIKYDPDIESLLIRCYFDRVPSEDDNEYIEIFATTLGAQSEFYLDEIDIECVYSTKKMDQLDCLDGFLYARQES